MEYDYVLSLFEECNFSGDEYKAIALMKYSGIDMSKNNPLLKEIIEHIECKTLEDYILYEYDEECDEWLEAICRTVLSSYEVDDAFIETQDSYVDNTLYDIPKYLRPYFDIEEYVNDLNLTVEDVFNTVDYDWVTVLDREYLVALIAR